MEGSPEPTDYGRLWRLLRQASNLSRSYFSRLLRVADADKARIYAQVFQNAEFADLNYWLEVIFSISIATLGLIINSPAVVIGAMLLSPLMGPIIASGLAIALGDFYLGFKAIINVLLSTLGSILLAALITWVLPFRSPTPEILARVQPTILDLGIAVLSGLAGTIVVCRGGGGGGVTALPGVAVAVALMPPLGVVGFGVGIGWDWNIVRGGGLLFLTNLGAIVLSSVFVFFSVRMDAPHVRQTINEWLQEHEKGERLYGAVQRTPLRRLLGKVGTLPRRVLILLIFLGMVALPLRRTLNRIVSEANLRRVVLNELQQVIPRESIFRQDLEFEQGRVRVRVVAVIPQGFSAEKRHRLEDTIRRRSGLAAEVFVYDVATHEELAELSGRLASTAVPVLETLDEIRERLGARLRPAIESAWPSGRAPLLSYRVSFQPGSPPLQLHLAYMAERDIGDMGEEVIRKILRERSGSNSIELSFERVSANWKLSFRPGADTLSADSGRRLNEVAALLGRFPLARCAVDIPVPRPGRVDSLSKKRTERIRAYFAGKNIPLERVQFTSGIGEQNSALLTIIPPAQP